MRRRPSSSEFKWSLLHLSIHHLHHSSFDSPQSLLTLASTISVSSSSTISVSSSSSTISVSSSSWLFLSPSSSFHLVLFIENFYLSSSKISTSSSSSKFHLVLVLKISPHPLLRHFCLIRVRNLEIFLIFAIFISSLSSLP
jgi:hypothetical protein